MSCQENRNVIEEVIEEEEGEVSEEAEEVEVVEVVVVAEIVTTAVKKATCHMIALNQERVVEEEAVVAEAMAAAVAETWAM